MKRRFSQILFIIGISLIAVEVISRLYFSMIFGSSFFKPSDSVYHFYPELRKVSNYSYDNDRINVLVLGGSVVYDDTVSFPLDGDTITSYFCSFPELLPKDKFNVLSLSNVGHNSLDSKYKYKFVENCKFDYILVYHGINDTRANNIESNRFDVNYRHIEFYDDIYVLLKHRNIDYYSSIFLFDWIVHSIVKKNKSYIDKENVSQLFKFDDEGNFFKHGNNILSESTFRNNYIAILELAIKKDEILILPTYSFYLDSQYTYDKFKNKELDYSQQIFPVELYGLPQNVKKGILKHNSIIVDLAKTYTSNTVFIDLESQIPKNKMYFDDICHLNSQGCLLFSQLVADAILNREE